MDGRSTTHHLYWTHLPIYWALIGATGAGLLWLLRARRGAAILLTFAAGVFVHLLLDSIAGGIYWLWPLSSRSLVIAPPAPQYDWWVWNFVFHWTFLFEFLLIGIALIIWRRGRRRRSNGQQGRAVGILDRSCEATR